jgi:hypothetical protein
MMDEDRLAGKWGRASRVAPQVILIQQNLDWMMNFPSRFVGRRVYFQGTQVHSPVMSPVMITYFKVLHVYVYAPPGPPLPPPPGPHLKNGPSP